MPGRSPSSDRSRQARAQVGDGTRGVALAPGHQPKAVQRRAAPADAPPLAGQRQPVRQMRPRASQVAALERHLPEPDQRLEGRKTGLAGRPRLGQARLIQARRPRQIALPPGDPAGGLADDAQFRVIAVPTGDRQGLVHAFLGPAHVPPTERRKGQAAQDDTGLFDVPGGPPEGQALPEECLSPLVLPGHNLELPQAVQGFGQAPPVSPPRPQQRQRLFQARSRLPIVAAEKTDVGQLLERPADER